MPDMAEPFSRPSATMTPPASYPQNVADPDSAHVADLRGQWPLDAHQLRHADQVDLARQITLDRVADDLSSRIECVACAHAYAVDGMFIRN